MSHNQFDEWCAKDIVEPIGTSGTNEILMRLGMVVAIACGYKDAKLNDFATWIQIADDLPNNAAAIAALEAIGARRV